MDYSSEGLWANSINLHSGELHLHLHRNSIKVEVLNFPARLSAARTRRRSGLLSSCSAHSQELRHRCAACQAVNHKVNENHSEKWFKTRPAMTPWSCLRGIKLQLEIINFISPTGCTRTPAAQGQQVFDISFLNTFVVVVIQEFYRVFSSFSVSLWVSSHVFPLCFLLHWCFVAPVCVARVFTPFVIVCASCVFPLCSRFTSGISPVFFGFVSIPCWPSCTSALH